MTTKIQPFAILAARLAIGFIFVMHGWQKWNDFGIDGTAAFFTSLDIPMPTVAAYFAATVELVGGILLILGAFMPVAGILLAATMFGAMFTAHWQFGFWMDDSGFEFVLALAAASIALAFSGGGTWSVDRMIATRRSQRANTEQESAQATA